MRTVTIAAVIVMLWVIMSPVAVSAGLGDTQYLNDYITIPPGQERVLYVNLMAGDQVQGSICAWDVNISLLSPDGQLIASRNHVHECVHFTIRAHTDGLYAIALYNPWQYASQKVGFAYYYPERGW